MQHARIITNPTTILILVGALAASMTGAAAAQTIFAGDMDDFGNSNDPDDTLVIRPLFAQYLARSGGNNDAYHDGNPMSFDMDGSGDDDWDFGYTFENLPTLNAEATLTIRVRSNTGSINDALGLQYTGDGNTFSDLWRWGVDEINGTPGVWAAGTTATFELALGNLPNGGGSIIADINAAGYLDVQVWDDTSVDWIQLNVPAPGTASLLALGGVVAMRPRREKRDLL